MSYFCIKINQLMPSFSFNIFFTIVSGFIFTYICIPPIVRISKEKHLFDVPNSRKLNKRVVPTLGGVGIFIGFTLSSILFLGNTPIPEFRYVYGSLIMLFFIGLKDDILILAARKKLIVQAAAALMLVSLGHFQIMDLSNLFYLNHLAIWLSAPLSFMILLFIINSINLIDGIDGLAAGLSIIISSVLGTWFLVTGHEDYAIVSFALTGSLLAFLRFNLWGGKFKIFMGDTGSLILGGILGVLVIKFLNFNMTAPAMFHFNHAPTFILSLLIVPVTDTLRVFAIRIYQKRSPFSPDMNHIHHLLIKSGMKHIQASGLLFLYTSFFVLLCQSSQEYLSSTASFISILSLSFMAVGILAKRTEKIKFKRAKQIQHTRQILSSGIPLNEDPFKFITSKSKILQN